MGFGYKKIYMFLFQSKTNKASKRIILSYHEHEKIGTKIPG